MFEYTITFSKRKTLAIHITKDAAVEVRAPLKMPPSEIEAFVLRKRSWVEKAVHKVTERKENALIVSKERELELRSKAGIVIPKRVSFYADIMGVTPAAVKISRAKTRWGSCSGKNSLNFSWRLMLCDIDVIDYVVVHECAHIKQHNHSKRFWKVVSDVLSDYPERRNRLNKMQRSFSYE